MILILCCLAGLLACTLSQSKPTQVPKPLPTVLIPTILPGGILPVRDASGTVSGICFEALKALDGQHFVLENETALSDFYTQLDSLCPEPVPRVYFDFSREILVLAFKTAQACTIEFVPQGITENSLMLQWRQTGNCPYEVVAIYAGALDRAYQGLQVNISSA